MPNYGFLGLGSGSYVHDSLILTGYFTEKIPQIFDCASFLKFLHANPQWCAKCKPFGNTQFKIVNHNQTIRTYTIPHPYAYAHLCKTIKDSWTEINTHVKSNWKGDRKNILAPRKIKTKPHVIFKMSYPTQLGEDTKIKIEKMLFGNRYLSEADISSCFPSIYSHSIAWSVFGRAEAYLRRNNKTEWTNTLDAAARAIQSNESNGLVIGPHASNILADIVLSSVDSAMMQKGHLFIRYIDDYKCYASTKEKAESFIVDLAYELSQYRLSLNCKKTKITELPVSVSEEWVEQLKTFRFSKLQGKRIFLDAHNSNEIVSYLDFATRLHKINNNEAVLRYAIRVLLSSGFTQESFAVFERYVSHLAFIFPYLTDILVEVYASGYAGCLCVSDSVKQLLENAINKNLYGSASIIITMLIRMGCCDALAEDIVNKILCSDDCILILCFTIYEHKNKRSLHDITDIAKALIGQGRVDEFWILLYELYNSGGISKISGYSYSQYFDQLKQSGVSFLNTDFSLV